MHERGPQWGDNRVQARARLPRKRAKGTEALFPIVGVGASAGGLDAFTPLLHALPVDLGMALVLVQHLAPEHDSQLAQILSHATSLPVHEVTDGCRLRPGHVYVIPSDTQLTIADRVLTLRKRQRARTPHRPIDAFFESLAADCHERAVGVVLSGTASDGTLGLEAIKAEGGVTFAQDGSAKHGSMPRSAVAAGCVDLVASPAEIAEELVRISRHPLVGGVPPERTSLSAEAYRRILVLLREHSGVDFALYKPSTILRRVHRRLVLNKCSRLDDYAVFLRGNPRELGALFADVLISVTSFFRNPESFELLERKIFPQFLNQQDDDPVRCWVLGCSTGQEAYSIAISFLEAATKAGRARRLQVFATDLSEANLERARRGWYPRSLVGDVSKDRLARFFVEEDGGYRVCKAVRELVVFARQDVISDPPFSRMNLISCRNVLIYFESPLQKKAIPTFHYALKPGGYLFLGASESIAGFTELFEPADKKHKIYVRKFAHPLTPHLPLGAQPGDRSPARLTRAAQQLDRPAPADGRGHPDAQREADRITIHQFAPPGVLVSADLQILQFRGQTETYLQPPLGRASFDLLKMAREGLLLPLRSAIHQAKRDGKPARRDDVSFELHGNARKVTLRVIPLKSTGERSFLVLFESAGWSPPARRSARLPAAASSRVAELESELTGMREYTRSIQERHEAAAEGLQAANEEVQSANEELQSVNEELETSKEELESTNEELTTLNEEMANRNRDLTLLNNDLVNLQTSARMAVLLLARDLTIRRFSPQAQGLFGLVDADVGRRIGEVRHDLSLAGTGSKLNVGLLASTVIAELREEEREVCDRQGRWFSLWVRPYVTVEKQVDGAVVVLSDIDTLKRSEQAGLENEARFRALFDTSPVAVYTCDRNGVIQEFNRHAADLWGRVPAAGDTDEIFCGSHQMYRPDGRPMLHADSPMAEVVSGKLAAVRDAEVLIERPDGSRVTVVVNIRPMKSQKGELIGAINCFYDITDRKRAEEETARLAAIVASSDDAIVSKNLAGVIQSWNAGARRLFGYTAEEAIGRPATLVVPADRVGEEESVLERFGRGEMVDHYETVCQHKDGHLIDVSLTTSPVRDPAGRVIGAAKIARDITVRKRMEMEARRVREDLLAADRRKDEFLAMLGHELRNPLSAVVHGLALLAKETHDPARSAELREMMEQQTGRIKILLDQLLDISRVISGKIELSQERVNVVDIVRAAVDTIRLEDASHHAIELTLPRRADAGVIGDPVRLTQVVENLVMNSVKYTPAPGKIRVEIATGARDVRIIVRDEGIGMSAEFLPHAFETFTQEGRALDRAEGGLGLGLPLVQRLVQKHGGTISATSPGPGGGSQFVVALPRAPAPGRKQPPAPAGRAGPLRPHRLLVVDDEQANAESLAELLEDDGHQAQAVHDGPSALAAARTLTPDVVLLDLGLPGMSGYDVAARLREEHGAASMLIVALTGYQPDKARLERCGFDRHVIKPTSVKRLYELITQWEREGAGNRQ